MMSYKSWISSTHDWYGVIP